MGTTTTRCGTTTGYRKHVTDGTEKCAPCREAVRRKEARYIKRRIMNGGKLMEDSTGSRRRLQALAALGWSTHDIGDLTGMIPANINNIARGSSSAKHIHKTTSARIKAAYDKLSMSVPKMDQPHSFVRNRAAKRGYLPPLAWDEDTIDDPTALPVGINYKRRETWLAKSASEAERRAWEEKYAPKEQLSA